jgi:hypothetical protein
VFTIAIGPQSTQLRLTSGPALPVQAPSGTLTVSAGRSITLPTRRPDLQSTSDLARCQQASASSYIPGEEPVAAVDGSTATPWQATEPQATLTVKLAKRTKVSRATVTRGSSDAFSYSVETSTDGGSWHEVATAPASSTGVDAFAFTPTQAQYVRLDFPGGGGAAAPDIDELVVTGP